ncbi:hypothetical protein SpCBS45565_g01211 [Spizellomyces sp. 'palustris']|nr:hypothetical protein SpCBS45565_g01211 [Spizellomyces sp. 'palustris']
MKLRVLSPPEGTDVDPRSVDSSELGNTLPPPHIRTPGEFRQWVKSWIALSRMWQFYEGEIVKNRNVKKKNILRRVWARREKKQELLPHAKLVDLPPEVLHQIASYLPPQDLAHLLQTPSPFLSRIAQAAIARRRHEITSLANLHTFLAYGGRMPLFYRTATMILFGRHFLRLVPEAKCLLGVGYAVVLAWFMVLFYTVPFLVVIAIYCTLDIATLLTRTTASLLLHTSPIMTTHHFPSFFRTPPRPSYTHTVRDLCFTGTTDPQSPSRGLLNPWASHLYLLTSCCPNLRSLHLVGCSLAWWFRLAKLDRLKVLKLEACELDETGMEILAGSCGQAVERIVLVGGEVRGGDVSEEGPNGTYVNANPGAQSGSASIPVQAFPALTHVEFQSRITVEPPGLKLILDRAPNITTIAFSAECKGLVSTFVRSFAVDMGDQFVVMDVEALRKQWNIT